MFDTTFALESLKRRWWVIVLIAILACALGLASMLTGSSEVVSPTYTAEATLHINSEEIDGQNELNLSTTSNEYLANDARRIVLNDMVAGEVRRTLGEDIVISTPIWQNELTKVENKTMFVFVDATASSESDALAAANMAAELAAERINVEFEGVKANVSDSAAIKTRSSGVADFGADSLTISPLEQAASSISVKKLVIFAGVGIIVGVAVVLMVDYCRRRIRSAHDVERLLGIHVIESFEKNATVTPDACRRCAGIIDALSRKQSVSAICLVGWTSSEQPGNLVACLNENLEFARIVGWVGMSAKENDARALAASDALVLVIPKGSQTATELDEYTKGIASLGIDVLGALYTE